MSNSGFRSETGCPGAQFAMVGGVRGERAWGELGRYRGVLWLCDADGGGDGEALLAHSSWLGEKMERVEVGVGALSAEGLEARLERFVMGAIRVVPDVLVGECGTSRRLERALGLVFEVMERHLRVRKTRQEDALGWQRHVIGNALAYAQGRLPQQWAGALRGIPAMIVGAGPSLNGSVEHLRRMAARGVVFAADSAWRVLEGVGIEPDFVVSVDVAKVPEGCVPAAVRDRGVEGFHPRLILTSVSPPEWQRWGKRADRFYVSGHQITQHWLAARGVGETPVKVRENCGATALELALFMGCEPVCLFGMDLALDGAKGGQRHAEGVASGVYERSGFSQQAEFPCVPGNFSVEVPTHVFGDWKALDTRLRQEASGRVWVVSDRGARLSNTRVMRPEAFELPEVATRLEKGAQLRELGPATTCDAATLHGIQSGFERFGKALERELPRWRQLLESGGSSALVREVAPLFAGGESGLLLGALGLKWMPHCFPPLADDAGLWGELLRDMEAVAEAFQGVGNVVGKRG